MTVTRCRPGRPFGPIPSAAAIVLGWWLVAHSSGQGWVQALGDVVAAGILIGLVGPWLVLRRVEVTVLDHPADTSAGHPVEVTVRTSRAARLTPVAPPGPPRSSPPLILTPVRHGIVTEVEIEIGTAVPFGLQWWVRRVRLALPHPIHVAPRRGPAARLEPFLPDDGSGPEGAQRRDGPDGDLRAPRPYRPGDARRLVHWPATAHTGELMVRELERPVGRPAELVVSLPPDPEQAEAEAEAAFGTILSLLERDVPVLLTTDEAAGPRTDLVLDRRQAARRMAAAV